MPRDQEGTRIKGWIQSNVQFGPISDVKVCNHSGRYGIEVKAPSLFQDQTRSWMRIVNGIDNLSEKPCRSKRKRKLRGNPLQKRTNTRTVIIPIGQRKWTDIETQESNDPCCFQVPKFITRLLRHRQGVQREADGAVHYDQVIDECQKKQFDNNEHWSVDTKEGIRQCPTLVAC